MCPGPSRQGRPADPPHLALLLDMTGCADGIFPAGFALFSFSCTSEELHPPRTQYISGMFIAFYTVKTEELVADESSSQSG